MLFGRGLEVIPAPFWGATWSTGATGATWSTGQQGRQDKIGRPMGCFVNAQHPRSFAFSLPVQHLPSFALFPSGSLSVSA